MDPLKLIKTQKPLGFLQSNPQILAEWVEPIVFIKNKILKNTLLNSIFMEWNRLMHFFLQDKVWKGLCTFSFSPCVNGSNTHFCREMGYVMNTRL